ncbi:MAG: putative small integral membrane protein [Granulosicoccus sp.]|jgi:predicted small integral membrane protein
MNNKIMNIKKDPATPVATYDFTRNPITEEKIGFLPIETNWFDRLFISVVIWVALSLFWLKFAEPLGFSVWIS